MMINSKVIRKGRKHISRADYESTPVILDSINVKFPRITTVEARALRRLFPAKRTLSHREFDRVSHTYCLRGCIDRLRYKGWTIVNHDEVIITKDPVPRKAMFTRYELFATPTPELQERIRLFCKAVDEFEVDAASTTASTQNKAV